MPPPNFSSRINLHDLRAKFLKLLGPKKDAQYFKILTRFLGNRVPKSVLDRQVLSIIGRENVGLHNHFIRAIYVNATCGTAPTPMTLIHTTSKPVKGIRRKPVNSKATSIESLSQENLPAVQEEQVNKDVLTLSSKKLQSGVLDQDSGKERQILLASETTISLEVQVDEGEAKAWGNGNLDALACRASHKPEDAAEQPDFSDISSALPSAPNANVREGNQLDSLIMLNEVGTGHVQVELQKNLKGAELEEEPIALPKGPIEAPLGVPFCAGSMGGATRLPISNRFRTLRHTLLGKRIDDETFEESHLPDEGTMQRRLEQVAVMEGGLQSIGSECANLLNTAVDIHLKRLISSCIELVKARHTCHSDKQPFCKQKAGASLPDQFTLKPQSEHHPPVSLLDFNLTMDLNPRQLGENWPTLLEKIALQRFEQASFSIDQKHLL